MLRFFQRLFRRPALRLGRLGLESRSQTRLRNERFASFLSSNNRRRVDTDRQDLFLSLSKGLRQVFVLGMLVLLAWIVLESAQAVNIF